MFDRKSFEHQLENSKISLIQMLVNLVVVLKNQGTITEEEMKTILVDVQSENFIPILTALLVVLKDRGIITQAQMKVVLEA